MISTKKINYLLVFELNNKYILGTNPVDHAIRGYESVEKAMQNFGTVLKYYLSPSEEDNIWAEEVIIALNPIIVEYNRPASALIPFIDNLAIKQFPSAGLNLEGVYVNFEVFKGCPITNVHKELLRIAGKKDPLDELLKNIPPKA